jgi:hypothetical protein
MDIVANVAGNISVLLAAIQFREEQVCRTIDLSNWYGICTSGIVKSVRSLRVFTPVELVMLMLIVLR